MCHLSDEPKAVCLAQQAGPGTRPRTAPFTEGAGLDGCSVQGIGVRREGFQVQRNPNGDRDQRFVGLDTPPTPARDGRAQSRDHQAQPLPSDDPPKRQLCLLLACRSALAEDLRALFVPLVSDH